MRNEKAGGLHLDCIPSLDKTRRRERIVIGIRDSGVGDSNPLSFIPPTPNPPAEMNPSDSPSRERWAGTVLILLSTSFYTASNFVLRLLTDLKVDIDWTLCVKETIGVACLLPWILFRLFQGRYHWVSKRLLLSIAVASVLCQLIGARLHVLGFAVLGLVITVPIVQSSTMLGTVYLGQYFLGDSLSQRRKIAMSILITAVILLSIGKALSTKSLETSKTSIGLFLFVAAGAVVAGAAYSIYIIILRYAGRRYWGSEDSVWASFRFSQWVGYDFPAHSSQRFYSPVPVTLTMLIVLCVGIVTFGSCLYLKAGLGGFSHVPPLAWRLVPITGICNMIGFFFQVQGLRQTSAAQASLIAVSQILALALLGILFFNEVTNLLVWIGLTLTASGVILSAKPEER